MTSSESVSMSSYIDALEESMRASLGLAEQFSDADWSRASRCPGWDLHDQVAHLVGLEAQLAGDPLAPEVPELPHITGPVGAFIERSVHARRGVAPQDLLAEFRQVLERRMRQLRARPLSADDEVNGVMGRPVPAGRMLPIRVFDVWAHEQDIRAAVGRPGNLASAAAKISLESILARLPALLADIEPELGACRVGFDIDGAQRAQVCVVLGADPASDAHRQEGLSGADVVLHIDFESFLTRICGRTGDTVVRVEGDEALGGAVLAGLAMTP
jgi:uncharacterized protein (TIGR03083 family)